MVNLCRANTQFGLIVLNENFGITVLLIHFGQRPLMLNQKVGADTMARP